MPVTDWTLIDDLTCDHDTLPNALVDAIQNLSMSADDFLQRCHYLNQHLADYLTQHTIDRRLQRYISLCLQPQTLQHHMTTLGVSPRHLRRLTQQYLGLTPKQCARVIRFQLCLRQMQQGDRRAWSHYYFDQAHSIHEFRQLCGETSESLRIVKKT